MKHTLLPLGSILTTATLLALSSFAPAKAQAIPEPLRVNSQRSAIEGAIAYPTSAQRFFDAGQARMEQEIQRLLQKTPEKTPILTIQPTVLEQPPINAN